MRRTPGTLPVSREGSALRLYRLSHTCLHTDPTQCLNCWPPGQQRAWQMRAERQFWLSWKQTILVSNENRHQEEPPLAWPRLFRPELWSLRGAAYPCPGGLWVRLGPQHFVEAFWGQITLLYCNEVPRVGWFINNKNVLLLILVSWSIEWRGIYIFESDNSLLFCFIGGAWCSPFRWQLSKKIPGATFLRAQALSLKICPSLKAPSPNVITLGDSVWT